MSKHWTVFYRGNRWFRAKPSTWIPMGKGVFFLLTGSGMWAMRYAPFRGVSKAAWFRPGSFRDVSLRTADWVGEVLSVKKVKVSDRATVKHLAPLESEMFKEHMPILEVLAMLQYTDGSPREPGYLGMWTVGATWFVRVQDKTGDAQMTAEGRTAEEAWDTLSVLLGSENPPWEPISRKRKKGG